MTTISAYLGIAGNDTDNNDLRNALTKGEGFGLNDEIRIAASHIDANLGTRLREPTNEYNIPNGLISRFITAADDARAAHLQAQASNDGIVGINMAANVVKQYKKKKHIGLEIVVFGVSNAVADHIEIDYDSSVDNNFILKEIKDTFPKFEKCEFRTVSGQILYTVKSFEKIDCNSDGKRIVYAHLSRLANTIKALYSMINLGYLRNILPIKKNAESGKTESEMWQYSTRRDLNMLVRYPHVAMVVHSVYFFSRFGIKPIGKVCFCYKQLEVLKSENISYAICYGEWDRYCGNRTTIAEAVHTFCQTDFVASAYSYCCYVFLIRLVTLKMSTNEWTMDEIVWFMLAFICSYLSHGAIFSIRKLFHFWNREKERNKWVNKVLYLHFILVVILLNVMVSFIANEYKFGNQKLVLMQCGSSLVIITIVYVFYLKW